MNTENCLKLVKHSHYYLKKSKIYYIKIIMKRTLTSQKHDLKTVQILSEIEVLHYMCESIKIVSGLLSYVVYFPQKVSLVFLGSCIAYGMFQASHQNDKKRIFP